MAWLTAENVILGLVLAVCVAYIARRIARRAAGKPGDACSGCRGCATTPSRDCGLSAQERGGNEKGV